MVEFYPEGILIDKAENAKFIKSLATRNNDLYDEKTLEARAVI